MIPENFREARIQEKKQLYGDEWNKFSKNQLIDKACKQIADAIIYLEKFNGPEPMLVSSAVQLEQIYDKLQRAKCEVK